MSWLKKIISQYGELKLSKRHFIRIHQSIYILPIVTNIVELQCFPLEVKLLNTSATESLCISYNVVVQVFTLALTKLLFARPYLWR